MSQCIQAEAQGERRFLQVVPESVLKNALSPTKKSINKCNINFKKNKEIF